MVLEYYVAASSQLVNNVTEVYYWRLKCNRIYSKNTQQTKFDWQNLIGTCNFYGNAHCELFVFVDGRILILLHQKPTACLQDASIWFQLRPNLKATFALNESEHGVEFKIWLKVSRKEKLYFHRQAASVEQNNFLSVKLIVDHNIHIVFFLLNIDMNIDAISHNLERDWLRIVLIFEKQSERLIYLCQFGRDKSKLNFCVRIALNFSHPFKTHSRYKLVENNL